jgi:tetratricopeptide (TPR) repeat protein
MFLAARLMVLLLSKYFLYSADWCCLYRWIGAERTGRNGWHPFTLSAFFVYSRRFGFRSCWLYPSFLMNEAGVHLVSARHGRQEPLDEPLHLGQEFFNRGIYGVAQKYFQDAVEKAPNDPRAWIGLAASYDHIRSFKLADRAYREAIKLAGETTQILNNQGYSYMLRGELTKAREKFNEAFQREPDNPTIQNNINLLNGSYRLIEREQ